MTEQVRLVFWNTLLEHDANTTEFQCLLRIGDVTKHYCASAAAHIDSDAHHNDILHVHYVTIMVTMRYATLDENQKEESESRFSLTSTYFIATPFSVAVYLSHTDSTAYCKQLVGSKHVIQVVSIPQ